jgi:F-type H+-transporting ATPase subunit gamma
MEDPRQLFIAAHRGMQNIARCDPPGQPVEAYFAVPNSVDGIAPMVYEMLVTIEEWHSSRNVDRFILIFNKHQAGGLYQPYTIHLLPKEEWWLQDFQKRKWPTRVLPTFTMNWQSLFSSLIRQYLFVSLYRAVAESLASEQASRLASMQGRKKISKRG